MNGWPTLAGRIAELLATPAGGAHTSNTLAPTSTSTASRTVGGSEAQVRALKAERDALLLKIAMLESDRDQEAWRLP